MFSPLDRSTMPLASRVAGAVAREGSQVREIAIDLQGAARKEIAATATDRQERGSVRAAVLRETSRTRVAHSLVSADSSPLLRLYVPLPPALLPR